MDWNDIEHAIPKWHRDNGSNPNGIINVILYSGHPLFSSSIIASLDDGKIIWTSYFKNPLVGYIKDSDKWFIAYSPANFYEWACSLAYDGKRLWFGVHTSDVIYSFQFNTLQLHRHNSIKGLKFGWDSIVAYKNGLLYVNGSVSFTQDELDRAIDKLEMSSSSS